MKTIIFLWSFVLVFSGCLMTHQDIQEKSLSGRQAGAEDDEDAIVESAIEQKVEGQQGASDPKAVLRPQVKATYSQSMTEQMAELSASLRELRGEITRLDKEREEQLIALKQGLISLIQALDLRVTALAEEVQNLKKEPLPAEKPNPEKSFHKAEQLFKEEKWKSAIIHYEKYRTQNKDGKFYKEATLQMGLCFQKLELNKEAKVFFRELVESYPKSDLAKQAQKLLSSSPAL